MFDLGVPELLLILAIVLVFFGKDRLPELARSIGSAARELRAGFTGPVDANDASGKLAKK